MTQKLTREALLDKIYPNGIQKKFNWQVILARPHYRKNQPGISRITDYINADNKQEAVAIARRILENNHGDQTRDFILISVTKKQRHK